MMSRWLIGSLSTSHYSAIQILEADTGKPLSRAASFPENFSLHTDWSPLLAEIAANTTNSGTNRVVGKSNVAGIYLTIRANGVVEPSFAPSDGCVTVARTGETTPVNFATVAIRADNARTTFYRP